MRAVSFLGNREAVVVDRPDPVAGPGQVVVKMVRAAICGSDLHRFRHAPGEGGPNPSTTPGHEPVGVVAQVGSGVDTVKEGQRVLIYHRVGCGDCKQCRTGNTNICTGKPRGLGWEGSDADYVRCYAQYAYPMPDDLSWDSAVVIACQGGTAYAPLRRVGASGRDAIVVTGLGPVGLCVVAMATAMGATVFGVDPMRERRELARRFGAEQVYDPTPPASGYPDPAEEVRRLTGGGADALIETSGSGAAHARVGDYIRTEGQIGFVGIGHTEPSMNPVALFRKQPTLFMSNLYPEWLLPEIVQFVQRQRVPLDEIITHRVPLAEAPAAFRLADTATTGKIVFSWGD